VVDDALHAADDVLQHRRPRQFPDSLLQGTVNDAAIESFQAETLYTAADQPKSAPACLTWQDQDQSDTYALGFAVHSVGMSETDSLIELRDRLRAFAAEREWDQFHSPKNLAAALSVEAAELLEHFQWLKEAESFSIPPEKRVKVAEEIADVLLYLVRIADKLDIDVFDAACRKIASNGLKYPADKARGSMRKYTDL
jgi:NTP pyrophosphatase (non-canonical NTP hydrolase)